MLPDMKSWIRTISLLLFASASACSFYNTATHWNGLRDADGKPVFVKTTTNIGVNLLIILPVLGNTTIDTMLDTTTLEIARNGGNRVRVIQSTAENYWYGWSPFTWIVTPVVTEIAVEYQPSASEYRQVVRQPIDAALEDLAEQRAEEERRAAEAAAGAKPPVTSDDNSDDF